MHRLYCVTAICLIEVGCQTATATRSMPTIQLTDNDSVTRAEVLKYAPLGSSIEHAQTLMEGNGFKCSHKSDRDGLFLYCDLQKSVDAFVGRRWQVVFRFEDTEITEVLVSSGLIGP